MSESVEVTEPAANDFVVVIRPERNKYWSTPGLKIALGADRIARVVGSRMLKHIVHSIKLGLDPAGGAQKPLKPGTWRAKKAATGTRPRARGFSEHAIFVNSLRLKKIRGDKKRAVYEIGSDKPEVFNEWQIEELARGVDYLPVDGAMARIIQKAVSDVMDRAVRKASR